MLPKPTGLSITFLLIVHLAMVKSDFYMRPTSTSRPETTELNIDYERIYNLTDRLNRGNVATIVHPQSQPRGICDHGLCYNTSGYPRDRIQRILSRSQFADGYFASSEEFPEVDITNRFNTDEMSLCETTVSTRFPERAQNLKKVERVIVNVENYKQGIVLEKCANTGKCMFSNGFPTEYTSYCKQKYTHKRLMVLEEGSDSIVYDTFEVPSCCVCTLKKV